MSIWWIFGCSWRSPRRGASRMGPNDLRWRWRRPARASRAWKRCWAWRCWNGSGAGVRLTAAGESLLDHARIVLHQVATMQGELTRLCARTESPHPYAREHVGRPPNICRRRWRRFCEISRPSASMSRSAKVPRSPTHLPRALPTSASPSRRCCPRVSIVSRSATIAWCWVVPPHDEIAQRRQTSFRDVAARDFIGLTEGTALQNHIAAHAGRKLGVRPRMRARLKSFDAICQMVEAGVGIAVIPEVAARRYRPLHPGSRTVRMSDPWTQPQAGDLHAGSGVAAPGRYNNWRIIEDVCEGVTLRFGLATISIVWSVMVLD